MTDKIFTRNCPQCNKEINHVSEKNRRRGIIKKSLCGSCAKKNKWGVREKTQQILELHLEGNTNKEIAAFLGITRNIVAQILKENNQLTHGKVGIVIDGKIKCIKCKITKELNEYGKTQNANYKKKCLICSLDELHEKMRNNIEIYLDHLYRSKKSIAKSKNIKFDISFNEFSEIFRSQNGKCFYTGIEMTHIKRKVKRKIERENVSVDKIIPELGYTSGNVVFCSYRINSMKLDATLEEMKEWMPGWYERIIKFNPDYKIKEPR